MILTKVVDKVGSQFLSNCCREPDREWFAASKPADITSEQEHFEEIEASDDL
jgi:hypothetical protein